MDWHMGRNIRSKYAGEFIRRTCLLMQKAFSSGVGGMHTMKNSGDIAIGRGPKIPSAQQNQLSEWKCQREQRAKVIFF